MLQSLSITNFAIIDHIDLVFRPGMTVLTGETGAGKSLVIDAISLLLGDRASSEIIRATAEKASISGVFLFENDELKGLLNRFRIDSPDGILAIRREINLQNKNLIKVNDVTVTLQQLKEITKHLADVHSQFDTQRLINPANYLELIDGFKREILASFLENYRTVRGAFRQKLGAYQKLVTERKELVEKNELYRFQWNELKEFHLFPGEEDDLTAQAALLGNYDKIFERLQRIRTLLHEDGIVEKLFEVSEEFDRLGDFSSEFKANAEKTKDFYYDLDDLSSELQKRMASMNFDPETLDRVSLRLNDLDRLKKKYKKTIPELLDFQADLETRIDKTDHFEEYVKTAEAELKEAFGICLGKAREISTIRRQIADRIEKELKSVFKDLVLPHAEFAIVLGSKSPKDEFDESAFGDDGIDMAEFLITTNVGEPLKPLSKTASGGEMSRIMLAFKTIFIRSQNLSTMVFDEIDTGISGFVAKQIAKKIKEISASCQVISISHIPQVVSLATTHLKVWKKEEKGRTVALVSELSLEDRVREIAEMISGERITENALQNARELLLGD